MFSPTSVPREKFDFQKEEGRKKYEVFGRHPETRQEDILAWPTCEFSETPLQARDVTREEGEREREFFPIDLHTSALVSLVFAIPVSKREREREREELA